ncbi:MAG: glycerophosphodiester phosphodiesterase family protein [Desulfotignum sp.]|nr:glycerophosphodiester phosphodiesterase family protein [Desulfotignum sp.]
MRSNGKYYFIAHRGASFQAPENTLASVNLAWKLGSAFVEVDVNLTADHKMMVCHDDMVSKSAGEKLVISQSHSEDLRRLDVGSWKSAVYKNERVPFLEEVIATIPEQGKLIIEIKCGPEILAVLKQVVADNTKKELLIFIGLGWETISAAKNRFPDNLCYWVSEDKEGLSDKIKECADKGLDGIDLYYKIIDSKIIEKAHNAGLEVLCWTVDDPVKARQLIDLGVTGITTNRPAWLKSKIKWHCQP